MKLLVFAILISAAYAEVSVAIANVETNVMPTKQNVQPEAANLKPLSSLTVPIDNVLSILGFKDGVLTTTVNFMKFLTGALTGQNVCSNVELSGKFERIISNF